MEYKVIEKEPKQLVINATKAVCNTVSMCINTMLILKKVDLKELTSIKVLLDSLLIMIQELQENETEKRQIK